MSPGSTARRVILHVGKQVLSLSLMVFNGVLLQMFMDTRPLSFSHGFHDSVL
jgi:hypothetical protein